MITLLSPKNDYVFKLLLSLNPEILADLLNCILLLPEDRRIRSVEVRNPEIRTEDIAKKFIILDIHAVDESGGEYDIEMQVRKYESYPQRTIYYACKLYADQLKPGEDYSELKPVFGIHLLDYEIFPDHPEFHFQFRFKDVRYPEVELSGDISIHIFELPKAEIAASDENALALMEWLRFFNHAHEKGGDEMREEFNNPMIHKAIHILENLSADKETRIHAEAREKALKDEAMFLGEAERRGRNEALNEVAKKMLLKGKSSIKEIAELTGLSIQHVEKLDVGLKNTTEH